MIATLSSLLHKIIGTSSERIKCLEYGCGLHILVVKSISGINRFQVQIFPFIF